MKRPFWKKDDKQQSVRYHELARCFESLGDNCEFGLVQRFCGAEPLGLLRFAFSSIDSLVEGLDTDFDAYGSRGDLELYIGAFDATYCRSARFGFPYIVSEFGSLNDEDQIIARESKKIAFLKRRFLEDLANGDKIMVRKGDGGDGRDSTESLLRALRRHGPVTLLHVTASESALAPGHVVRDGDGLLLGRVRRFAPYEKAGDIDLPCWLELCANAVRTSRGGQPPVRHADRPNLIPWLRRRGGDHRPGSGERGPGGAREGLELFGHQQDVRDVDHEAVHVLSAWIWLPGGFQGADVHPAIGHLRLAWRYPDLAIRDAWQFVWVSAMVPDSYNSIFIGLVVVGAAGEGVRSRKWRFERSPSPYPTPPPAS